MKKTAFARQHQTQMKSKIKTGTYIPSVFIAVLFISMYIGATIINNPFVFNSLVWWIVGFFLMGYLYLILISFQKIPRFTITNDTIQCKSKDTNLKIGIANIEKIERVDSSINGWYSKRGGLKIHTKNDVLVFPYHVYSNESEMLQLIYQSEDVPIERYSSYSLGNFVFMKYFYRNFGSFCLIMALVLMTGLITKGNTTLIGMVIISPLLLMMIAVFILFSKFLKVEDGHLYHISPLLLKSVRYDIDTIEYANSKYLNTGSGGIKNLTIQLKDKRIVTLIAGLNRQINIDIIRQTINKRFNDTKINSPSLERTIDKQTVLVHKK